MELRTILYGYGKDHLRFYAMPGEADVVRRIFREYISGKTMKQIADGLSREKVAYYKDKCSWTKNAVCRIIENEHYTGDAEYPAIVSGENYKTANTLRNGRGGKREADSPEVALLKRRMYCAECGHRYTRRRNYSGARERWECPAYCKTGFSLDDKALYGKLADILNRVIDEPDILRYDNADETVLYEPNLEMIRRDREIDRMTEQKNLAFLPVKAAIYDAAAERYDLCRFDPSKAVTAKLIEYIRTLKKNETPDFALIERIVKRIAVHHGGKLSVVFLNDKTVYETEEQE